jgi:hypothetical protein
LAVPDRRPVNIDDEEGDRDGKHAVAERIEAAQAAVTRVEAGWWVGWRCDVRQLALPGRGRLSSPAASATR